MKILKTKIKDVYIIKPSLSKTIEVYSEEITAKMK